MNLDNKPFKESESRDLLRTALEKLRKLGFPDQIQRKLRDSYGFYAYATDRFILVAKKYLYGNVISTHSDVPEIAERHNKKVIMYIDEIDRFYIFSPTEILRTGVVNFRGNVRMINFEIKLGVRYKNEKVYLQEMSEVQTNLLHR